MDLEKHEELLSNPTDETIKGGNIGTTEDGSTESTDGIIEEMTEEVTEKNLADDNEFTYDTSEIEYTREEILKELEEGGLDNDEETVYDSSGKPVDFQGDGETYTSILDLGDILIPPRARRDNGDTDDLELSINQWGLVTPIHVIPYRGKHLIVHGVRRYKALKNLGYTDALCLVDETRPSATVRFLEVIANNCVPYDLYEILKFGEFVERKQKTFSMRTIEKIIGLEDGDYVKAKYIREFDTFGIMGEVASGKKSIKDGFKKLEKELEKEEKERLAFEQEELNEQGLPESYLDAIEEEPNVQDTKDRQILPKHISDKVKSRDKYSCQTCGLGLHQPELTSVFEVHHIIPVAQKGHDGESNLILLCSNCHKVVHAYGDGKFLPPEERTKHYSNMIILGNILRLGVKDGGGTPYQFYMDTCHQPWIE